MGPVFSENKDRGLKNCKILSKYTHTVPLLYSLVALSSFIKRKQLRFHFRAMGGKMEFQ
jgi:hypothetical protein